jgi:regulator of protease activity HflC (stomatin/prohibitin superfamily)
MQQFLKKIPALLAITVLVLFGAGCINNIEGHERGVRETCNGVQDEVYNDGTYFFVPICHEMYTYNVGKQLFTMNDRDGEGVHDEDRLEVKVKGGQTVWLHVRVEYQLMPSHLVSLHRAVQDRYEEILLRPEVIRETKDRATTMEALDIFSDSTRVDLQNNIEQALLANEDLKAAGIVVFTYILEKVELDPEYAAEIKAKAVAQQTRLKEIELAAAAEETAKRIAADAKGGVETARAKAEAAKVTSIKAAEAEKESAILAADGEKQAAILAAEGIKAKGEAEAAVEELKRDAMYAGEAGKRRAAVEIATARARELKGTLEGVNVVSDRAVLQLIGASGEGAPMVTPVVNAGR